jgi:hypothetical protein
MANATYATDVRLRLARRPSKAPEGFAFEVHQPKVRRERLDGGNAHRTHQPPQQRRRHATRRGRRWRNAAWFTSS